MTPDIDSPALLLDASTPSIHAGILSGGTWLALERAQGDALSVVPDLLAAALKSAGLKVAQLRCLIHCEGPGALLGLRVAAMCIETWRSVPGMQAVPLLAYRSLPAMAAILRLRGTGGDFHIATPFRRGSYNVCEADSAANAVLDEAELAALPRPLYFIPQRRFKDLPAGARLLEYDLAELPRALAASPWLLRVAANAEAFSPQPSEYQLWHGQRHRAPERTMRNHVPPEPLSP
jgi:tRNA threonylcarbamoyladenosine biosynthesis protein TsaB